MSMQPENGPRGAVTVARGWAVHLLTASGAAWGILALHAIGQRRFEMALGFMGLALVVDSIDGALARRVGVSRAVPAIDGARLDDVVDFLNYTAVPACFLLWAGLLPDRFGLPLAGLLGVASALQFAHVEAKTDDHFFRGFPSYWNVVALYLFLLRPHPALSAAVVLVLAALSVAPVRFVYPSRTPRFRALTLALTAVWFVVVTCLVVLLPEPPRWLTLASLGYPAYYVGISLVLTAAGRASRSARLL
jgi:phosphatidylcholine synthase